MARKNELTVKELGRVFEKFQKKHKDCPGMYIKFSAFMAGEGIRPGIYYANNACYVASSSTNSVEEFYEVMKKDIGE